jgi:ketosteroid isomerase-like protein
VSENSDSTRRGFAAFSRGDWEETLANIDPEIEWHLGFRLPDLPPDKTVFKGHDEVRELWDAFRSVWDELTLEPEEILYDKDDVLIVKTRFRGRGGSSGIEVDRVFVYIQELRDGKLLRQRPFDTEDEAFAAAGVERD